MCNRTKALMETNPYANLADAIGNARFAAARASICADRLTGVEQGREDEESGKADALHAIADAIAALERARAKISAN